MPLFFTRINLSSYVCSALLIVQPLAGVASLNSHQYATIGDAIAIARIKGKIEKLKNSKGKPNSKVIGYLLDIKEDIQNSFGTKINLSKALDEFNNRFKKEGKTLPPKYLEGLKKMFKNSEKKHRALIDYTHMSLNTPGYIFNDVDFEVFKEMRGIETGFDEDIPTEVVVGVTIGIVGVVMMAMGLAYPPLAPLGKDLAYLGGGMVLGSLCARNDKN